MKKKLFLHAKVFSEGTMYDDYGVLVEKGKIVRIGPSASFNLEGTVINLAGDYLVPGFIDLHIHGLFDILVENGKDDVERLSSELPQFGVTGFLPTVVPHLPDNEKSFLQNIAKSESTGADILGIFCEGPFIAKTGAILPDALGDKSVTHMENMKKWLSPKRVVFALAPEIEAMEDLIPKMGRPIFITHTQASVEQTQKAIELGARHATHFYDVFPVPGNPVGGVRPVGAVEVILSDPRVTVDFILDGEHVAPVVLRMAKACKPITSISLITDSNFGAGLAPGVYQIGSEEVSFAYEGAPARGTANSLYPGSLNGSGLTLDRAVKNVLELKVGTLEEALTMVSTSPAKVLELYGTKGNIQKGFDADIVRLSSDLEVLATWVRGDKKY